MKNNYSDYRKKVYALGYTIADIERHLVDFFSYKTTQRYFSGKGVSKANEQTIKTHIDNLEPKEVEA